MRPSSAQIDSGRCCCLALRLSLGVKGMSYIILHRVSHAVLSWCPASGALALARCFCRVPAHPDSDASLELPMALASLRIHARSDWPCVIPGSAQNLAFTCNASAPGLAQHRARRTSLCTASHVLSSTGAPFRRPGPCPLRLPGPSPSRQAVHPRAPRFTCCPQLAPRLRRPGPARCVCRAPAHPDGQPRFACAHCYCDPRTATAASLLPRCLQPRRPALQSR